MARRRLVLVVTVLVVLLAGAASMPLSTFVPSRIVRIAYEIERYDITDSWGGGHGERPGPTKGTCLGYSGRIKPCPAARTRGLDCSGLARWVYALANGRDVLGPGNTDDHVRRMRPVERALPGDLVFFGKITKNKIKTHHVGIYLGRGKMMNAPETGASVRIDDIGRRSDFAGFYRY